MPSGTSSVVFNVPAEGDALVDLRLGSTGIAKIEVVDTGGKPVANAEVYFVFAAGLAWAGTTNGIDAQGMALSRPLPSGTALRVRVHHPSFGAADVPVTVSARATKQVRVTLQAVAADR